MSFTCRLLNENDYDDILVGWWKSWRWEAPKKDMLPQEGLCGVIVSKENVDICAGFLFLTNSKVAHAEYIISNFEYKDKDRKEAIEFLIHSLSAIAKDRGCKYIFTSLKNDSLISRYENCGYKKGSTGCTEMIKVI